MKILIRSAYFRIFSSSSGGTCILAHGEPPRTKSGSLQLPSQCNPVGRRLPLPLLAPSNSASRVVLSGGGRFFLCLVDHLSKGGSREDSRWGGWTRGEDFFRQGTDPPRDGCRRLPGELRGYVRGDFPAQGARANCLYHGARHLGTQAAAQFLRQPQQRPDLLHATASLTFRCQKHCSSTYARNSVSTKLTIAAGECLKQ